MKMSFIMLAMLLTMSSCDQSSDSNKNQTPTPPTSQSAPPPAQPQSEPPPVVATLPEVSFTSDTYVMNERYVVQLELKLSKASAVPVTVDVALVDGSASFGEDHWGFNNAEHSVLQTVVFAPEQTLVQLPMIKIPRHGNCNVEFSAQLVKTSVQQAEIKTDTAKISIPCL